MTTQEQALENLPPLPPMALTITHEPGRGHYYTAYQMREYALASIANVTPACTPPVEPGDVPRAINNWQMYVTDAYQTLRRHNSSIPDDVLDAMRDQLLLGAQAPKEQDMDAKIKRLERELNETPLRYSFRRILLAMHIDSLKEQK